MRRILIALTCVAATSMIVARAQQEHDILTILGGASPHQTFSTSGSGDSTMQSVFTMMMRPNSDTTLLAWLEKNGGASFHLLNTSGVHNDSGQGSVIDLLFTGTPIRDTLLDVGFLDGSDWFTILSGAKSESNRYVWPIDPVPQDIAPSVPDTQNADK